MGTEVLKSYDNLQVELERARNDLKGLNENIRRIIGRDPPENSRNERKRNFNERRADFSSGGSAANERGRQQQRDGGGGGAGGGVGGGGGSPPAKRRQGNNDNPKSVFSRLSGPPPTRENNERPRILSRVFREMPSRQDIVAAQGTDAESRARNRRMFGCLLGTLQKFCQEESRLKPKEEKKAQIEKKLEEQQIQERENLKKERLNMLLDRKRRQQDIKIIEHKMMRMKELSEWEESKKLMANFIRTKTRPHVYYLPKTLDKKTQAKLDESRQELTKIIEKRRQEVNDELEEYEKRNKNPQNRDGKNNHQHDDDGDEDDDEHVADDDSFSENEEHTNNSLVSQIVIDNSPASNTPQSKIVKIKREREDRPQQTQQQQHHHQPQPDKPKIYSEIIVKIENNLHEPRTEPNLGSVVVTASGGRITTTATNNRSSSTDNKNEETI